MPIGSSFDDVVVAAQAGAAWAFEVLYRDLSPAVTGYLRMHGALDPDDLLPETPGGDVEDDVLTRLGTETVHRMCAGLPADQRSVLLLRVLADLTVEQVAAVMDRSVGSVKALQRRGLRRLRAELEPAGTPRTGETGGTAGAPLAARPAMTGAR